MLQDRIGSGILIGLGNRIVDDQCPPMDRGLGMGRGRLAVGAMALSKLPGIAGERPGLRVRRGWQLETYRTHSAPEQSLVCDTCRSEYRTMLENKYTQFQVIDRRSRWYRKFYKYLVMN